jgi:tRNA(Ile)-lysidine synthase
LNKLFEFSLLNSAPRWIIAYSGGVDSHVLLKLAIDAAGAQSRKILVIHVHHGLSPFADSWLTHCQMTAKNLSVEFKGVKVNLANRNGESLEAYARAARYEALAECLEEGDVLLTGHHQDDQAETFLLQLMRGAGLKGLSVMPQRKTFSKGFLVRPFLSVSRQAIFAYATANQLVWINDESNSDLKFDRNFMRQEIIPLLQSRWPALNAVLSRTSRHMAEGDSLLMELGREDYRTAGHILPAFKEVVAMPAKAGIQRNTLCSSVESLGTSGLSGYKKLTEQNQNIGYFKTGILARLSISVLSHLSDLRLKNALRAWLHDLNIPLPSEALLSRLQLELMASADDKQGLVTWDNYELRSFNQEIYLCEKLEVFESRQIYEWDGKTTLTLPIGTLTPELAKALNLEGQAVQIRFRQGGERFHPEGRAHSQTLKNLFQEWGIPTWLRDRVPLFYINNQLLAVLKYKQAP